MSDGLARWRWHSESEPRSRHLQVSPGRLLTPRLRAPMPTPARPGRRHRATGSTAPENAGGTTGTPTTDEPKTTEPADPKPGSSTTEEVAPGVIVSNSGGAHAGADADEADTPKPKQEEASLKPKVNVAESSTATSKSAQQPTAQTTTGSTASEDRRGAGRASHCLVRRDAAVGHRGFDGARGSPTDRCEPDSGGQHPDQQCGAPGVDNLPRHAAWRVDGVTAVMAAAGGVAAPSRDARRR